MHKTDQHTTSFPRRTGAVDIAYLGIDIAKAKFDVALLRPDQKLRARPSPTRRPGTPSC